MKKLFLLALPILLSIALFSPGCKDNPTDNPQDTTKTTNKRGAYYGFSFFSKLPGVFNGYLDSGTMLGDFPEWVVDFRPISGGQIIGKSELDKLNDIFLGVWAAKYGSDTVLVFRNGGHFAGMNRITYTVLDTFYENSVESFYRFVDFKMKKDRVQADFTFRKDSLYLQVYTNKNFHFKWSAKRLDAAPAQKPIADLGYPKKEVALDLTGKFDGAPNSTFFNVVDDFYSEEQHPYLGKADLKVSFGTGVTTTEADKILVVASTKKLLVGSPIPMPSLENLKARSRYVVLSRQGTADVDYTFTYMHPGAYYLNCILDKNGDGVISSGDYVASAFDKPFTINVKQTTAVAATVDFKIP